MLFSSSYNEAKKDYYMEKVNGDFFPKTSGQDSKPNPMADDQSAIF